MGTEKTNLGSVGSDSPLYLCHFKQDQRSSIKKFCAYKLLEFHFPPLYIAMQYIKHLLKACEALGTPPPKIIIAETSLAGFCPISKSPPWRHYLWEIFTGYKGKCLGQGWVRNCSSHCWKSWDEKCSEKERTKEQQRRWDLMGKDKARRGMREGLLKCFIHLKGTPNQEIHKKGASSWASSRDLQSHRWLQEKTHSLLELKWRGDKWWERRIHTVIGKRKQPSAWKSCAGKNVNNSWGCRCYLFQYLIF